MKLVLNIERVGRQSLTAQRGHDLRRSGDLSHVKADWTELNQVLAGSGDCPRDCQAVIDTHKAAIPANNDKPFTRLVLSASPEHFKNERGELDPKPTLEFRDKAMKFLKEQFGDSLAYAVLHLDETTPHIHAVVVPLHKKKTKKRESWTVSHHQHPAFKGLNSFERFRRQAADSLGLDYGEPGNKPKTKAQREAEEAARMAAAEARQHMETAKGLSREYVAALKADAKALGRAIHFPTYDLDPTTPEARKAVADAVSRKAAQRPAVPPPVPVQQPTRRRFWEKSGDSR